jgi:hypothetical protein
LWNCIALDDLTREVEAFMKEHTHLTADDVSIEFDPHEYEISLEAAGKSHVQYMQEMEQYKEDMRSYKIWQATKADEITAYKESEKKRIAKAKLQRTQERLKKEMAAVEAKLEKA